MRDALTAGAPALGALGTLRTERLRTPRGSAAIGRPAPVPPLVDASCVFSPCRRWRYALRRVWDRTRAPLVVIGLNPSTADETHNDPTVRRCIDYALGWNTGGLVMLNAFAFRSTDPRGLRTVDDPVGPDNDATLDAETRGRLVVCAWGVHAAPFGRDRAVLALLAGRELHALGVTKDGHPRHPLYLRRDAVPTPYPPREAARA